MNFSKTGCKIICGAPMTLAVKGLMMMKWTSFRWRERTPHFLLHCFDIQIHKNVMTSQRSISVWSIGYIFSWIIIVSIKLMTRMMDGCLILNKLGRRRMKLCQREWWQHGRTTVEMWAYLSGFSCPTQTLLLLLAPVLLGSGEATRSELLGMKRVKQRLSAVVVWTPCDVDLYSMWQWKWRGCSSQGGRRGQGDDAGWVEGTAGPEEDEGQLQHPQGWRGPVSYTHLTLPTKLSV